MVERLDPLLSPPDELELPPVMLDVTTLALFIPLAGVQPPASGNPFAKQFVATQAKLAVDSLLWLMALETSTASIEIRVRRAELPRGNLGAETTRTEYAADNKSSIHQTARPALTSRTAHDENIHPYPVLKATAICSTMKMYITIEKGLWNTCQ